MSGRAIQAKGFKHVVVIIAAIAVEFVEGKMKAIMLATAIFTGFIILIVSEPLMVVV